MRVGGRGREGRGGEEAEGNEIENSPLESPFHFRWLCLSYLNGGGVLLVRRQDQGLGRLASAEGVAEADTPVTDAATPAATITAAVKTINRPVSGAISKLAILIPVHPVPNQIQHCQLSMQIAITSLGH